MIPMLTSASTVICPHGGQALLLTTNTDALVQGAPVLLQTDVHAVVGCPFFAGPVYSPCVTIRWLSGATQTSIRGTPVLLRNSVGLCQNAAQAPQGTAVVVQTQTQAQGV
jgi:hypothetical protein